MRCMLVAKAAIFLILDSSCLLPLVFCCRIISMFANRAFECDYVPHCFSLIYEISELTTGLEPVTYALPRRCSTS